MGEPQTLHFYDFEIFGLVLEPQHQPFVFLETPLQRFQDKYKTMFDEIRFFTNHKTLKFKRVDDFGKGGCRQILPIRLTYPWESCIRDHYLPEKWNLFLVNLWIFETKKRWNQETAKLWNQTTTKLWNQETKEPTIEQPSTKEPKTKTPIILSSKGIPSTPQHSESHPCTLLGDTSEHWRHDRLMVSYWLINCYRLFAARFFLLVSCGTKLIG